MKYLFDTDHISVLQQQSGPDYAALSSRIASRPSADLALSIISFHEQVLGCHTYINRARTSADLVRGYRMFGRLLSDYAAASVLPFDAAASAVFDVLQTQRVRISTMDLRIASIALAHGLTLVTRNSRDFQNKENRPGFKRQSLSITRRRESPGRNLPFPRGRCRGDLKRAIGLD